ncbi:MAG: aldehyde dehydrogenase family protein [Acidobacteria bacterium]|nr:MAG: aldehyde dehydrogenase family protein [Acidobacteriota bacterium]
MLPPENAVQNAEPAAGSAEGDAIHRHVNEVVYRAAAAAEMFRRFEQDHVDRIVQAAFEAAWAARVELARLAADETGIGVFEHKVIKNAWASLLVFEDIRHRRTVGVLAHDPAAGVTQIAQPLGPILATIPVTNPTSTAIFKALICLKTRNPVIFSAHRGARKSVRETVRLLDKTVTAAGAPPHAIQALARSQTEYLDRAMRHKKVALILATGTSSIVRMAEASGTPTLGVGPGNVPVYVHKSADLEYAARAIAHSKTFDNGTICASEQALVVEKTVGAALRPLLEARGAHFCSHAEMEALGPVCYDTEQARMRPGVVGRPAPYIAALAGFSVPLRTRLLIAEPEGVGPDHPLSNEILAPVLALYQVDTYEEAIETCEAVNHRGGTGHTVGVYANDDRVVEDFARMNAARILVNTPSTEGAVGGIFNSLRPSLSLACGAGARNLTTDNISTDHLLNIHRVARLRPNQRWSSIPRSTWLDAGVNPGEILKAYNRNY